MVYPRENPAVTLHVLLVVGGVLGVILEVPVLVFQVEGAGIGQVNIDAKGFEAGDQLAVELGHTEPVSKREGSSVSGAGDYF